MTPAPPTDRRRLLSQENRNTTVDKARLLGRRISIAWPDDGEYYDARVIRYMKKQKKYKVVYEQEGSVESLNIRSRNFKVLQDEETDPLLGKKIHLEISPTPDDLAAPTDNFFAIVFRCVYHETDKRPAVYNIIYIADEYKVTTALDKCKFKIVDMYNESRVIEVHNPDGGQLILESKKAVHNAEGAQLNTEPHNAQQNVPWIENDPTPGTLPPIDAIAKKRKLSSQDIRQKDASCSSSPSRVLPEDDQHRQEDDKTDAYPAQSHDDTISRQNSINSEADPDNTILGQYIVVVNGMESAVYMVVGWDRDEEKTVHRLYKKGEERKTLNLTNQLWAEVHISNSFLGKRLAVWHKDGAENDMVPQKVVERVPSNGNMVFEAFVVESIDSTGMYVLLYTADDMLHQVCLSEDSGKWKVIESDENHVGGLPLVRWRIEEEE